MTTTVRIDETDPARIAERALTHLGDDHRTVAAALTTAGYTGIPESVDRCPVARYLKASDPRLTTVIVSGDEAQLEWGPTEVTRVDMPTAVCGFIVRFDSGRYPDLVALPQPARVADPGTHDGREDTP